MNWKFWTKSPEKKKKPISKTREWFDAILFAVVAATLIRWLIMEAYTIPTPSMENSLLVNDYLFVSKFHYGTRTTSRPLQLPLTHQKIWFTNIPSYLDWIKLPSYRLPGFTSVQRNDVVVFNIPPRSLNDRDYPADLKINYIKRCLAIPGDTIQVDSSIVKINGVPAPVPPGQQLKYLWTTKSLIKNNTYRRYGLSELDIQGYTTVEGNFIYHVLLTQEEVEKLKTLPFTVSMERQFEWEESRDLSNKALPYNTNFGGLVNDTTVRSVWDGDQFGPLWVPSKGATIEINLNTLRLYAPTIVNYEHNENAEVRDNKLFIDGQEVTRYTFKQDYYFMMGDNRNNSLDSRYWGFVPDDHIVGKALFIWMSIDREGTFFDKVRWNRLFRIIR